MLNLLSFEPEVERFAATGGWLLIAVENLSELFQRVNDAGCEVLEGPRDRIWLFRDFTVKDPCGNVLCLFRRLPGWERYH